MQNPVAIFLLLGIVLSGAALGYWIVRKFVISEDGNVDVGVAQFVKWAMRIIGAMSIFQSTPDAPLALGAFVFCWAICYLICSLKRRGTMNQSYSGSSGPWQRQNKQIVGEQIHPELPGRSNPRDRTWRVSDNDTPAWSSWPVRGAISPSSGMQDRDYYSTFHKTPNRKKFTKKAWNDFTRQSTQQALAQWASSPEFTDWIMEHADRIQLLPSDSSDETVGSESDSTNEDGVGSGSRFSFLNW